MSVRNTVLMMLWLLVSTQLLIRGIFMVAVTIETELVAAKLYGLRYIAAFIH